jgi:hypothetical protein
MYADRLGYFKNPLLFKINLTVFAVFVWIFFCNIDCSDGFLVKLLSQGSSASRPSICLPQFALPRSVNLTFGVCGSRSMNFLSCSRISSAR